jgi:hypothetical protein
MRFTLVVLFSSVVLSVTSVKAACSAHQLAELEFKTVSLVFKSIVCIRHWEAGRLGERTSNIGINYHESK